MLPQVPPPGAPDAGSPPPPPPPMFDAGFAGPAAVLFPNLLEFGGLVPGDSLTLSFDIANLEDQKDVSVRIEPLASDIFSMSGSPVGETFTLIPSERTTVDVRFAPLEPGQYSGEISVDLCAQGCIGKVRIVALSPPEALRCSAGEFSETTVGSCANQGARCLNPNDYPVEITAMQYEGAPGFLVEALTGDTLPALSTARFSVFFCPTEVGQATAQIGIEITANNASNSSSFTLEGTSNGP